MKLKRKLPPKPPSAPPGYMLFHQRVVPIQSVEAWCKSMIGHHDDRPRPERDRNNYPEEYRK